MPRRHVTAKARRHQQLGLRQRFVIGVGLVGLAGHIGPARQRQLRGAGGRNAHGIAPDNASGSPSPRAFVSAQNRVYEFGDRIERRPRRFTMRRMSSPWNDRHIDRTIALFLRDLDLPEGPILVIHTLQDCNRHAYVGEIFGNIPAAKFWVEPGAVPAMEALSTSPCQRASFALRPAVS